MKHELGKYLLDCSKILIGGVILARIVKAETISNQVLIPVSIGISFLILFLGLVLIKKSEK